MYCIYVHTCVCMYVNLHEWVLWHSAVICCGGVCEPQQQWRRSPGSRRHAGRPTFSCCSPCASESIGRRKPQVADAARHPRQHTGGAVCPHRSVSTHTRLVLRWTDLLRQGVDVCPCPCPCLCGGCQCAQWHGAVRCCAAEALLPDPVRLDSCSWIQPGTAKSLQVRLQAFSVSFIQSAQGLYILWVLLLLLLGIMENNLIAIFFFPLNIAIAN